MRIKSIDGQELKNVVVCDNDILNDISNSLYHYVSSFDIAKKSIKKVESQNQLEINISFLNEIIEIKNGKGSGASRLKKIAKSMQAEIFSETAGKNIQLPVIARYNKNFSEDFRKEVLFSSSRTYGYKDCFSPSFVDFALWIERLFRIYYDDVFENKSSEKIVEDFDLIKNIQEYINIVTKNIKCENIAFSVSKNAIVMKHNDHEEIPISKFDFETKRIIGIVGDIIRRCVILNPAMRSESIKKTPGIVMIEQINDTTRKNLEFIFPNIQFIYGE